jgi:hypothetical protein
MMISTLVWSSVIVVLVLLAGVIGFMMGIYYIARSFWRGM